MGIFSSHCFRLDQNVYKSQTFWGPMLSAYEVLPFLLEGIWGHIFPAYVNCSLNFLREATVPILKSILSLIYSTNTYYQGLICQALWFWSLCHDRHNLSSLYPQVPKCYKQCSLCFSELSVVSFSEHTTSSSVSKKPRLDQIPAANLDADDPLTDVCFVSSFHLHSNLCHVFWYFFYSCGFNKCPVLIFI